jgi:hypothetical protein
MLPELRHYAVSESAVFWNSLPLKTFHTTYLCWFFFILSELRHYVVSESAVFWNSLPLRHFEQRVSCTNTLITFYPRLLLLNPAGTSVFSVSAEMTSQEQHWTTETSVSVSESPSDSMLAGKTQRSLLTKRKFSQLLWSDLADLIPAPIGAVRTVFVYLCLLACYGGLVVSKPGIAQSRWSYMYYFHQGLSFGCKLFLRERQWRKVSTSVFDAGFEPR